MPSNTSRNNDKSPAAADQLASLEVTDGQANAKSFDSSSDGPARPSEEEDAHVLEPELWRPHPPTTECPVCFVPLPLEEGDSVYLVCCGKSVCLACTMENLRATKVINAKRKKKKQPPLDHACPFCRTIPNKKNLKEQFKERIRKGDRQAACSLAFIYRDGDDFMNIPKNEAKSLKLLHHAADDFGFPLAMAQLGVFYFHGVHGARKDEVKGQNYLENAVKMGNVFARFHLGRIEKEEGNIDLAIRHLKLAAAAGEEKAVKMLWEYFYKGALEKAELEVTLRAYQEACDTMNSVERERRKLLDATVESEYDIALFVLLNAYYDGLISAKQLKEAMKKHQTLSEKSV